MNGLLRRNIASSNDFPESLGFRGRMPDRNVRLPPLDLLLTFEAAARLLSFTRARCSGADTARSS